MIRIILNKSSFKMFIFILKYYTIIDLFQEITRKRRLTLDKLKSIQIDFNRLLYVSISIDIYFFWKLKYLISFRIYNLKISTNLYSVHKREVNDKCLRSLVIYAQSV